MRMAARTVRRRSGRPRRTRGGREPAGAAGQAADRGAGPSASSSSASSASVQAAKSLWRSGSTRLNRSPARVVAPSDGGVRRPRRRRPSSVTRVTGIATSGGSRAASAAAAPEVGEGAGRRRRCPRAGARAWPGPPSTARVRAGRRRATASASVNDEDRRCRARRGRRRRQERGRRRPASPRSQAPGTGGLARAARSRTPPHPLGVLAVLDDRARGWRRPTRRRARGGRGSARAGDPVDRLGHARRLVEAELAQASTAAGDLAGEHARRPRAPAARTIATSRSKVGCSTQW